MFTCILLLLICIANNQVVSDGARYGLLLWYKDVLPLLLPFIIVSNLLVSKLDKNTSARQSKSIGLLFFLGVLCGYPLGAKLACDLCKRGYLSTKIANRLLPMCNNISPMFLSGYIGHIILRDQYSFVFLLSMLYLPYLIFIGLSFFFFPIRNTTNHFSAPKNENISCEENELLLSCVIQITYVGIYIMLCSILLAFIRTLPYISACQCDFLCGLTEVTQGTKAICLSSYSSDIKTALILGCTSFGGICAFLQTIQVTKQSGLSMSYYILVKLLCAIATGWMCYLII